MNNRILLLIGISSLLGVLINLYLIPVLIYLSKKHGLFDKIDHRKIHTKETSRLGGIGIYISFIISCLATYLIVYMNSTDVISFNSSHYNFPILMFSTAIIFAVGVLDDFAQIRARYKLLGQLVASIIAIWSGAEINTFLIPFTSIEIQLGLFSYPITILWIIGITNSVNLIDGLDGLSSGIAFIASFTFGLIFLLTGNYLSSIICFSLVAALLGYLFFNLPPAKIFMGDSGSLFLGFILAVIPIATFPTTNTSLIMPITLLFIPILDVITAIWRRLRDKKNIFRPDRFHVHHKLLDMGLNTRNILALIYGFCLILSVVTVLFESTGRSNFSIVFLAWSLISTFFIFLHFKKGTKI